MWCRFFNKKIILIFIFFILILFSILLFRIDFMAFFMKSESLNYNKDVASIIFWGNNKIVKDTKEIKVDNKQDIMNFFDYLNSFNVIKKENINDINFKDNGHFYVEVYGQDGEVLDSILFTTRYLIIYNKGIDWEYTSYYIKDSGYNPIKKSTNISKYVNNLINN